MAIILFFSLLFVYFEWKVDPFMMEFTVLKGKQMMSDYFSQTVNNKMAEMNLSYNTLVDIKSSNTGEVQSINTDVVTVNKLKNEVTTELVSVLEDYYEFVVDFPLGNVSGSEFFSGLGPTLELNSLVTGSVTSDFRSEFESGGFNQTVHRLYIDITGNLIVIVGGEQEPITLTTSVLVGETVIVGSVPSLYAGDLYSQN